MPEQLRLGHGSRMEAQERVQVILGAMDHLMRYVLDDGVGSIEVREYWSARVYRLLGNLNAALREEETWSDSE